jgi:hypothetical protein
MRKPKPRTDDHDAVTDEELLDALCWRWAKDLALITGHSQEDCADRLKQSILDGHHILQLDSTGDRIRLIPAWMN